MSRKPAVIVIFFQLEQPMSLIEFDILTKEALLTHLFLEQSDEMMGRMAQDIWVKTPEGDALKYASLSGYIEFNLP